MADASVQEVCSCGTEYLSKAGFCHNCGKVRPTSIRDPMAPLSMEYFVEQAAESFRGEGCLIVLFQPWSELNSAPVGILAPAPRGEDAHLEYDVVEDAMEGISTVLMPCTFETEIEEAAAKMIIPKLGEFENITLLIVLLTAMNGQPALDDMEDITARYTMACSLGVDDVLTLETEAHRDMELFHQNVTLALWRHGVQAERIRERLAAEPQCMEPELWEALQQQHKHLIWTEIPKEKMNFFPKEDPDLLEGEHEVGDYNYTHMCETASRSVMHAVSKSTGIKYAIKITNKQNVLTPADLESIYREMRFLTILVHPNITHAHEILHSNTHMYLVLEYAGPMNLAQLLTVLPGQRLAANDYVDCFGQLATALTYCHEKNVVHRSVSLENLGMQPIPGNGYRVRLIDFSAAFYTSDNVMSYVVCGTLPCMAPEMAFGTPYLPKLADCWSAGAVLLEMSGGVTSMSRAVPFDIQVDPMLVAGQIRDFFDTKGNHAKALAYMGGVNDVRIIRILEMVLTSPSNRQGVRDCLDELPPT